MEHIFRGEIINDQQIDTYLRKINRTLIKDVQRPPLDIDIIINAVDYVIQDIINVRDEEIFSVMNMPHWQMNLYIDFIKEQLSKDALYEKVNRELGSNNFKWKKISDNIEEKYYPYGVLLHFGAGNAVALSVLSVIEGLITGNINILKPPSYENGISTYILKKIIDVEPRLKPYIYVFNINSKEENRLKALTKVADGLIVWGSEEAIYGARQLAPPSLPIIEWGHKIGFAYFTKHKNMKKDIKRIAKEICETDQQFCSSPQSIFLETDNMKEVKMFATYLSKYLYYYSKEYPQGELPFGVISTITYEQEVVSVEKLLTDKDIIKSEKYGYSILIDHETKLKMSPLYRNIWVMPIKRRLLNEIIRPHRHYLQTVGLSCSQEDEINLMEILYRSGVTRINRCGDMSTTYSGEPHDGRHTLLQYLKCVSRRR